MKQILFCLLLLNISQSAFAGDKKRKLSVGSSPVNMKPSETAKEEFGIGFNRISMVSDRTDDFFTGATEVQEPVGRTQLDVTSLAVGWIKATARES
ncbi:MAG: hypothetical protein HN509_04480 [Halobacteriovoraceae bacterium]|jgi:hypothetical protein|nr:hypothetical protein [Halobacteriovoraceae bacterium]MBT5093259.1 hypothetical protein [Halobacteriovoraceae bacterium]